MQQSRLCCLHATKSCFSCRSQNYISHVGKFHNFPAKTHCTFFLTITYLGHHLSSWRLAQGLVDHSCLCLGFLQTLLLNQTQEIDVRSLYHPKSLKTKSSQYHIYSLLYSLKTKSSQCHYIVGFRFCSSRGDIRTKIQAHVN